MNKKKVITGLSVLFIAALLAHFTMLFCRKNQKCCNYTPEEKEEEE